MLSVTNEKASTNQYNVLKDFVAQIPHILCTINPHKNNFNGDLKRIRYAMDLDMYGQVILHRRSTDDIVEHIIAIWEDLHVTTRNVLNAIFQGCNHHKLMFYSRKTIGKLCGISEDRAGDIINELWRMGWFKKRRRWSDPGTPWKSCIYSLSSWSLNAKIRLMLSNVIPALGDPIEWHTALCLNYVCINSLFTSRYSTLSHNVEMDMDPTRGKSDDMIQKASEVLESLPKTTSMATDNSVFVKGMDIEKCHGNKENSDKPIEVASADSKEQVRDDWAREMLKCRLRRAEEERWFGKL